MAALSLNPRFDGAFLNYEWNYGVFNEECLNPRFDGAFLNLKVGHSLARKSRLNPRFDGAFLNSTRTFEFDDLSRS